MGRTEPASRPALAAVPLAVLFLAWACGEAGGAAPDAGPDGGGDAFDWDAALAQVFPADRVVQISIDFHDPAAYDQMVAAAAADPNDTPFFAADLTFDEETVANVGVRLKGNSSLWQSADGQMKSFKVHFEEYVGGQDFHGLDRLNLHNNFMDPSSLRETLAYGLARDFGLDPPRTALAAVRVDGQRHGVYTLVQQIDSRFLEERFGEDGGAADGNLYKCHDGCPLAYWGDDPACYQGSPPEGVPSPPCDDTTDECGLSLETNEDDPALNDFADVLDLVRAVDGVLQGQAGPADLDAVLDMDGFVRFQAWSLVLSSLDSYFGSAHNFYLYHRPADGRFQFIPWDVNLAFGTFECPQMCSEIEPTLEVDLLLPCFDEDAVPPPQDRPKPLVAIVAQVPEYTARYCAALRELVDGVYTAAGQAGRVAELRALLDEERQQASVMGQPPFDFTYEDYLTALSDQPGVTFGSKAIHTLGYFDQARLASVAAQLEAACP
jgi:hypothetical protein